MIVCTHPHTPTHVHTHPHPDVGANSIITLGLKNLPDLKKVTDSTFHIGGMGELSKGVVVLICGKKGAGWS